MKIGIFAWLAGVIAFQQLAILPSPWLILFSVCGALGMWRSTSLHGRVLAWGLTGFLWSLAYAHITLPTHLVPDLVGQDIEVTGEIASVPEYYPEQARFELVIKRAIHPATVTLPDKVRLSWRDAPRDLQPGQLWQLTIRLKPPRSFANPGSFDYEAWLLQKGIGATGYVRVNSAPRLISSERWSYPVQLLRHKLRNLLEQSMAGDAQARVVVALVLGIQSALTEQDWVILRDTGTAHLLAISGLHISLTAGMIFWLTGWLWRRSSALCLWLAAPRAAALLALFAALAYSALAGFSIPTQRACLMLLVVFGAILFNFRVQASSLLALALWLILIWDPLAVMAMGFWLSFGAVAILLYLNQAFGRSTCSSWGHAIRTQLALGLGLTPLLVVFFERVPIYAGLVNLIAIPMVSLVIVPLLLVGTLLLVLFAPAGKLLLTVGAVLIHAVWWFLTWAAGLPYATLILPMTSVLAICIAVLALAIMGLPRGIPGKWLMTVAVMPMLLPPLQRPDYGEMIFTLLDVGQGLAATIQTQHHLLVFDTGPRFSERFDAGEAVLVPFLRHHGYSAIDHLMISHGDADHIGGVQGIINTLQVKTVSSSVPDKLPDFGAQRCVKGQHWEWEGVAFTVLHPPVTAYDNSRKENDLSCVLLVSTGNTHVLLTGDIEATAEAVLLSNYRHSLASTILVAPHHGSMTSSTPAFIQAVQPKYVLFATGQYNRFRFPRPEIIERYRQVGAIQFDTARHGALQFRLLPDSGEVSPPTAWRWENMHYWQQR